jgi:hypothetical protein
MWWPCVRLTALVLVVFGFYDVVVGTLQQKLNPSVAGGEFGIAVAVDDIASFLSELITPIRMVFLVGMSMWKEMRLLS